MLDDIRTRGLLLVRDQPVGPNVHLGRPAYSEEPRTVKNWWHDNWFGIVMVLELGVGMLIIGLKNGWS